MKELTALGLCIVSCVVFAYLSKKVTDFTPKATDDPSTSSIVVFNLLAVDWFAQNGNAFASIFTANWLVILELIISIYLILDYLLFFVLASDK